MCVVIHSDGHMTIKMLYEQIWPGIRDGKLDILECYDLVFRWHGEQPLTKLYILSPQGPSEDSPDDSFTLLRDAATGQCDWIFREKKSFPTVPPRLDLAFVGPAQQPTVKFQTICLEPSIRKASWIDSLRMDSKLALTAFEATRTTLAEVSFGDVTVRKYDPSAPSETTYYVRLAFRPAIHHLTPAPIPFGPVGCKALFHIQPCVVYGPCQALRHLGLALERLTAIPSLGNDARKARDRIFAEVFERNGTSTRIEDHRVSLVIPSNFLIVNATVLGDCSPLVLETPQQDVLPRSCAAGAKHHPHTDPLTLAREVYGYLKHTATNESDAKTKEMISSALSCRSHNNISHVVEALRNLRFVRTAQDRENLFVVTDPPLQDDQLFMRLVRGSEELDLRHRDNEIRNHFYGELAVPGKPNEISRFQYPGFSIFYDLAFCT